MEFFFINDKNERLGPFTVDQLRSQPITPSTLVWSGQLGMQQWTPAGQMAELATLFAPVQPNMQPVEQPAPQQPIQQPAPQQPVQQPAPQQPVQQPAPQQPIQQPAPQQPFEQTVQQPAQQPAQQPYQQQSYYEQHAQQPYQQPYQQQPYQQPYGPPVKQSSGNKKLPLIIGAVVIALALLGGLAWWMMNNRSKTPSVTEDQPAVVAEQTGSVGESYESTETEQAEVTESDENEGDEVVDNDEVGNSGTFAPRHSSSNSQGFSSMVLSVENLLRESGAGVSGFSDMRALGKVNGNQIIYEHSDGVRYQFFFDKPVKSPSATLTGIAVSRKTNAPYTYCAELQDALEDQGYYELNTHLFGNGNGMLYSPGYKGDRVYCYIYRPNAPDKSPAPRD